MNFQSCKKNKGSDAAKGALAIFADGAESVASGSATSKTPSTKILTIPLTQGKNALIDESDLKTISELHWCYVKTGKQRKQEYAVSSNGIRMHRLIMDSPKGFDVDHVNGNGIDNRRANLRICNRRQNMWNRGKADGCSCQHKGVKLNKVRGIYEARIRVCGHQKYLGGFRNAIEAALAYDRAAIIHFGEFARLNFPHTNSIPSFFSPRNFTKKQSENLQLHRKTI